MRSPWPTQLPGIIKEPALYQLGTQVHSIPVPQALGSRRCILTEQGRRNRPVPSRASWTVNPDNRRGHIWQLASRLGDWLRVPLSAWPYRNPSDLSLKM